MHGTETSNQARVRQRGGSESEDALVSHGIALRRESPGTHRAACPECARAKARKGDTALRVTVKADGWASWHCFRCGWFGWLIPQKGNEGSPERQKGPQSSDRPRACTFLPPDATAAPAPSLAAQRAAQRRKALALWRSALPIVPGTVAADYLAARGCALPHSGGDLRWHPEARHPSDHVGPALLALVTDAVTGEPLTLHRTWITPTGEKAAVQPPRLLWPGLPKAGGVVRLWPDEEVTTGLAVAEGMETALTLARGFGLAWATVDAGNLAKLPILAGIEALTIAADHDEHGRGEEAARTCAERWAAAGVEVRIWLPGKAGADLNDLLRGAL